MKGFTPQSSSRYTPLLDDHMVIPSLTGGGKSTDFTNFLMLEELGVREKFGRWIVSASSCELPEEFDKCTSLKDVFQNIRKVDKKKFNPFWLVMIDFYWGRQSTRENLEVYYTQEQLGRRLEELCAKERGTDEVKFTRNVDEKMTVVFSDDQDIATKDSLFADGRMLDIRKPEREHTRLVSTHNTHATLHLSIPVPFHHPIKICERPLL